jgi:hypothetical protein
MVFSHNVILICLFSIGASSGKLDTKVSHLDLEDRTIRLRIKDILWRPTAAEIRLIYSSKITCAFLHQKVCGFLYVQLIDFR